MLLSTLLKSAASTCPFCHPKAGILTRQHPFCRQTFQAGWNQMVNLATAAARSHNFDEKSLRLTLAEIAQGSYGDGTTVNQALEAGWKLGVDHAMADGIISQHEEIHLRLLRDQLALDASSADLYAAAQLQQASTDRLMLDARLAALAINDAETHLADISTAIREARLSPAEGNNLLTQACALTVEDALVLQRRIERNRAGGLPLQLQSLCCQRLVPAYCSLKIRTSAAFRYQPTL